MKALKGANQEQLALYYGIGRFISYNSREGFWGKDAISTISRQFSLEMPGLRGSAETKYYIQLCADLSLSVDALTRKIAEDAYHNQGEMPNNFTVTIPDYKRAFQAIQMFKDEYLLDYQG